AHLSSPEEKEGTVIDRYGQWWKQHKGIVVIDKQVKANKPFCLRSHLVSSHISLSSQFLAKI
ncbi:hypothetical protein MKW98_006488, partial [Papaver atlanticum]